MSPNLTDACSPSLLQPFALPHWPAKSPSVWVKRDDLIHAVVSGNKWRKLAYVKISPGDHIVSIGGGYSNHLHALGYRCAEIGASFTALVRGNYEKNMTPMLKDLVSWGSTIHYLTKKEYALRDTPHFMQWVIATFANANFIPEGGSTALATKGVGEMVLETNQQAQQQYNIEVSHFVAPVASGATLAGIALHAQKHQSVIGIAVLKGKEYLHQQVARFLDNKKDNWSIEHDFVHGGYAKTSPALLDFCRCVNNSKELNIEPVYSGKAFYALDQLIMANLFDSQHNIVIVHTGGLQGIRTNK